MTFLKYCCGYKLTTSCILIACILLIYDGCVIIRMLVAGTKWQADFMSLGENIGRIVAIGLPICCCLDAVCSIMLIFGAVKRRALFLIPWMLMCAISILLFIICFIIGWAMLNVSMIIVPVVMVSLLVYFGIVVHSLYEEFTVAPIIVT